MRATVESVEPETSENPQRRAVDWFSEAGASMVEYALLVTLIAIIAVVAISLAGTEVSGAFSDIADALDGETVCDPLDPLVVCS